MQPARYIGIDFSGGAAPWRPRCARPSVWVATVEAGPGSTPWLADLLPAQQLPGDGQPFDRLIALLRAGDYAAAAIDAPFSLPAEHLPPGGQPALLTKIAALPPAPDRPFPSGAALVDLAMAIRPLASRKPLRATERHWRARGINVRSTLWNGPRGGAPFAAACLSLLARAGRPIWPWMSGPGLLAEAFPAAQLRTWGLPHAGYAAPGQRAARETILAGLRHRILLSPAQVETLLGSADALDAVLAAFGAIAAVRLGARSAPLADGEIAVMDALPAASGPADPEQVELLLAHPAARIERIVSRGHVTPWDQPYRQAADEWVMLLAGEARLLVDGEDERRLHAGDVLFIPRGRAHWATYTSDPAIWLAVHLLEGA